MGMSLRSGSIAEMAAGEMPWNAGCQRCLGNKVFGECAVAVWLVDGSSLMLTSKSEAMCMSNRCGVAGAAASLTSCVPP